MTLQLCHHYTVPSKLLTGFLPVTQNVRMICAKKYEKLSVKIMVKILSVRFLFRHCVHAILKNF